MLESGHTIADYSIVKPLTENRLFESYQVTGPAIESARLLLIASEQLADKKVRKAFIDQSQALLAQSFPGVCNLIGAEIGDEYSFCLYPFPQGTSLAEQLSAGFSVRRSLAIVRAIACCLSEPHAAGFWHGALSPDAVYLDEDSVSLDQFSLGSLLRLDFHTGVDPHFCSPELVRGEQLGTATDLYSLGIILYRLLTGVVPFSQDDPFATAMQHVQEEAPPLVEPLTLFQPLLDQLLCADSGDRLTAAQLVDEIDGFLQLPELDNLISSDVEDSDESEFLQVEAEEASTLDKLSAVEKLMNKSDMASRIEERLKDRAEVLKASQDFTSDAKRANAARMAAIEQSNRMTQDMDRTQNQPKSGSGRFLLLIALGVVVGAALYLFVLGPKTPPPQTRNVIPESLLVGLEQGSQQLESGDYGSAEKTFQELIRDFSMYPQPYNNLAAVYAQQGNLEQSRNYLERAMATNDYYVAVYRNLGTVYSEMARDSYGRALQLEKGQQAVMLQIFSGEQLLAVNSNLAEKKRSEAEKVPEPVIAKTQESAEVVPETAETETKIEVAEVVQIISKPEEDVKAVAVAAKAAEAVTDSASVAAVTETEIPEKTDGETIVVQPVATLEPDQGSAEQPIEVVLQPDPESAEEFLRRWAAAWSEQNVEAYLGYYAAEFIPANGSSREAWAAQRKSRLTRPKTIEVTLTDFSMVRQVGERLQIEVTQGYKSDRYADRTRKIFDLTHDGDDWQIVRERSRGRVR
jgi:serine/threonine protein kinase